MPDYDVLADPGEKCTGTGWPLDGEDNCLGCGKVKPRVTRHFLVAAHSMTANRHRDFLLDRQYRRMAFCLGCGFEHDKLYGDCVYERN